MSQIRGNSASALRFYKIRIKLHPYHHTSTLNIFRNSSEVMTGVNHSSKRRSRENRRRLIVELTLIIASRYDVKNKKISMIVLNVKTFKDPHALVTGKML